jgi:hypothetical protein
MKTLNIYLKTAHGEKKVDKLNSFAKGVERHGIKIQYVTEYVFRPSDYALIFSYASDGVYTKTHNFRRSIIQDKTDKQIFFVDSNVLGYFERNKVVDNVYRRYPFRSIHPHEADFLPVDEQSFKRTDQVKKDLGLTIKDWRKKGDHILICLNRGIGGFSTFGKPCYEWAREVIQRLRLYTDRKIIIRSHRAQINSTKLREDQKNLHWILNNVKNVKHTTIDTSDINDDLKNAWACVVYTSTAGAVALMKGIPVFTYHPACFFRLYSSGDLAQIEEPKFPDRDMFLTYYVNSHWSLEEIKNGDYWEKFKNYRIDVKK